MQKFKLENGYEMDGRDALKDTMDDLIVDGIGAFVSSIIGYLSLKNKTAWMKKILIRKKKEEKSDDK